MGDGAPTRPDEIFAMLRRIMVREFDLHEDEIQLTSGFEDLDMDSIDAVDLAVSVEEEIGFQFETEDLAALRTLQDVVDLIHGRCGRTAG